MSDKLTVSILQRDLTDSSTLLNLGTAFAPCLIAWYSIGSGLAEIELDRNALAEDLEKNIVVVAEGIQTVLKFCGQKDGYQQLKELTQGQIITRQLLLDFIEQVELNQELINQAYEPIGQKTIDDIRYMLRLIVNEPKHGFNIVQPHHIVTRERDY